MSWCSAIPVLVPHRQPIQLIPVEPPLRHELIHQPHDKVVLQAGQRLLCQLGVQPDVALEKRLEFIAVPACAAGGPATARVRHAPCGAGFTSTSKTRGGGSLLVGSPGPAGGSPHRQHRLVLRNRLGDSVSV
jgi:hypothetical protein